MTTFNTAAAPKAPSYLADLAKMTAHPTYILFQFQNQQAAQAMFEEHQAVADKDGAVTNVEVTESEVSVYYREVDAIPAMAKAISEAYGIELN